MEREEATRRLFAYSPIVVILGIKKDGVSFDSVLAVDDDAVREVIAHLPQLRIFELKELDVNTFIERFNNPPKTLLYGKEIKP